MKKLIIFLVSTLFLFGCVGNNPQQNANAKQMLDGEKMALSWQLGWAKTAIETPSEFIPAKVPGSVQIDIAKAKKMPSYHFGTNVKLYQWMENQYYTYKTTFEKPALSPTQRLFINGKGIDYKYQILVNGTKVYAHEGIFKRFQIDITDALKSGKNVLEVKIDPVPVAFPEKNLHPDLYRSNASKSAKPPVSYGWDWHPRLIPLGIWDDFDVEVRNESNITYASLTYKMSDDLKTAHLKLNLEGNNIKDCHYSWELLDKNGKCAMQQKGTVAGNNISVNAGNFNNPNLWWTHDHGTPYLYTWKLTLSDCNGNKLQSVSEKIGFRKIRLVMNEGEWQRRTNTTRVNQCNMTPMQVELNGKQIFAKGSNWVNPEVFYSELDRKRYEPLVDMAIEAHFNIFRVWGGAIINKDSFFDLCNEKGILVWQEFPLSCNYYPDDEHYVKVLEAEARDIVKRVRKNPCVAMWCGGNELFNAWSKMTPQSMPLRMLNSVCYELDPETPFNYTSPLIGVGHGHYKFRPEETYDAMTIFSLNNMVAYTEFGVNGAASLEAIKRCIPEKELFPLKETPSWVIHHGTGFWGEGWIFLPDLEYYVGKINSLEELVDNSQFMQAQGYKALFEEARRQKPHCSMAVNWDYNEAWTVTAGNALIEYPVTRKPAFYAVKDSCRPVVISGKFNSITWKSGDVMPVEIWLLNDTFEKVNSGDVEIFVRCDGTETKVAKLNAMTSDINRNVKLGDVKIKLPNFKGKRFEVVLKSTTNQKINSTYGFIVKK